MFSLRFILVCLISAALFSACAVANKMMGKGEKPALPRVLVLGLESDNSEIADKITLGLLTNLTTKVESFDPARYELLISCITYRRANLPPPPQGVGPTYTETFKPVVDFSSSTFYSQLEKSQYFRTKVYLETDLDYVVTGQAKEQERSELEQDIIVTAKTASVKMLSLHDGSFPVKTEFKQGFFEIVAPDRIGSKLADRINNYLKTVRKTEKREAKQLRQKLEE